MESDRQAEEENIARLIQAGFGNEVRPSHLSKTRTLRVLINEYRKDSTREPFPDVVIASLGGIFIFAALWYLGIVLYRGSDVLDPEFITIVVAWMGVNLVLSPVTGLLILVRRWRNAQ